MKNLIYPFNLLNEEIYPIFGNKITGLPTFIDLSKNNKNVDEICNNYTQKEFNDYMISEMNNHGTKWAVSGYLEDRTTLLKKYPQMVNENRVFHLGLDITAPLNTEIFSILDAEVVISEYESGDGNYGGMLVLKHNINDYIFYTLYGHLNVKYLPNIGTNIKKGDIIGKLGDFNENGNWFYHTHLQVLTEIGYKNGWVHKGYCSDKDLPYIGNLCPNPIFLLK